MQISTKTTNVQADGTEIVRGEQLVDVIANYTFSETIFLMLTGNKANEAERRMMDAIFSSIIDNGPAVASAMNARISASAGNNMHTALAAGVLGFGPRHGVALEAAMHFLYTHLGTEDVRALLVDMKERREYVPGLGHKIFTEDPRAAALFKKAEELDIAAGHCEFIKEVHEVSNELSSKVLPINVDGAIAAILCDMGIDSALGEGLFVIGRMPGLVAQVHEEVKEGKGIRRLDPSDVDYQGK
ncbi:MAG: citryl-CoA lyase [Candidatus Magasanikbacteria bacterium]|jgi:citryl-CoA lyase|nr:citryl-CoA lyase [Candidatus Magasanikbacteria bacterium]